MGKEEKKIVFAGIEFVLNKKNVRYYRIELSWKEAVITAPVFGNVKKFLESNREKIVHKKKEIAEKIKRSEKIVLCNRDYNDLRRILSDKIKKYEDELGVDVKEIKLRQMTRTLGNCRKNGVLTFNKKLKFMPDRAIEYIVCHELLHLKINGGHTRTFKQYMMKKFPDLKDLDEIIRLILLKLEMS